MNSRTLAGDCSCGKVTLEVTLTSEPKSVSPRACDCHFCRENDAAYISDPNGMVIIRTNTLSNLNFFQQGNEIADFIFCSECKQLLGVRWNQYGSVNARVLYNLTTFGKEISVSPQQLSSGEKVERWQKLWFREFVVTATNA